jgi:Protein of unknown function (DUF4197)
LLRRLKKAHQKYQKLTLIGTFAKAAINQSINQDVKLREIQLFSQALFSPAQISLGEPMIRRYFSHTALALALVVSCSQAAFAGPLDAISNAEANAGLKAALDRGALAAISQLGVSGGFMNNPKVKIPLPGALQSLEPILKATGKSDQLNSLVATMNQAAEQAVPEAKVLLQSAVKSMTLEDAKGILTGGDDSVTQFFKAKTKPALTERFQPIVGKQVSKLGLTQQYDKLAGQGAKLGLVDKESLTMESYVTGKALDGLYLVIAEQERAIRQDPIGTGVKAISKVFGILK